MKFLNFSTFVGNFYPPGSGSGSTDPIESGSATLRRGNETMCHEVPGGRGLVDGTVGPGLEDDLINSHRLFTQHQLTVVLNKISLFKLVWGPKRKTFFSKMGRKNPWNYYPKQNLPIN
jgi:hypothetical protein